MGTHNSIKILTVDVKKIALIDQGDEGIAF